MNDPNVEASQQPDLSPDRSSQPHSRRRSIPALQQPSLAKYRAHLKEPKKVMIGFIALLILIIVPLASALNYTVQPGDNLTKIARQFNTTVEEIATLNNIKNPNIIFIGQKLEIPSSSSTTGPVQTAPVIPNTPVTTDPDPDVDPDKACMRFNFLEGQDNVSGSRAGTYILEEVVTGKALVSWFAASGALDSGWINDFSIMFNAVHVKVLFYPSSGGDVIEMEIVNPAPGTTNGWVSRGLCHAVEIQYPN